MKNPPAKINNLHCLIYYSSRPFLRKTKYSNLKLLRIFVLDGTTIQKNDCLAFYQ